MFLFVLAQGNSNIAFCRVLRRSSALNNGYLIYFINRKINIFI